MIKFLAFLRRFEGRESCFRTFMLAGLCIFYEKAQIEGDERKVLTFRPDE